MLPSARSYVYDKVYLPVPVRAATYVQREAKTKGKMASSAEAKATKKIIVRGIPSNLNSDKLTIYFQKKKKVGGGDVQSVTFPKSNQEKDTAIVAFEESETVRSVLEHGPHTIGGKTVQVSEYSSQNIFETTTTQLSSFVISEIKRKYDDVDDKLYEVEDSTGVTIESTRDVYAVKGEWLQVQAAFDRISEMIGAEEGTAHPMAYLDHSPVDTAPSVGRPAPSRTDLQEVPSAAVFDKDIFAYMKLEKQAELDQLESQCKSQYSVKYVIEEIGDAVKVKLCPTSSPSNVEEAKRLLGSLYGRISQSVHQLDFKLDTNVADYGRIADEVIKMLDPEFPHVHITRMHEDKTRLLFIAEDEQKCGIAKDQFKCFFDRMKQTRATVEDKNKIQVDCDVLAYADFLYGPQIRQIWEANGARVLTEQIDDCVTIRLTPAGDQSSFRPEEAITAFQRLYSRANESVQMEEIVLGRLQIEEKSLQKAIQDTKKYFKGLYVGKSHDQKKVMFLSDDEEKCKAGKIAVEALLKAHTK